MTAAVVAGKRTAILPLSEPMPNADSSLPRSAENRGARTGGSTCSCCSCLSLFASSLAVLVRACALDGPGLSFLALDRARHRKTDLRFLAFFFFSCSAASTSTFSTTLGGCATRSSLVCHLECAAYALPPTKRLPHTPHSQRLTWGMLEVFIELYV